MDNVGGVSGERLRIFIQRIERLEEEKTAIATDIREVFAEAKSNGFDVKTMRKVLKLRKQNEADRQEEEALLETYLAALGMGPLFDGPDDEDAPAEGDAAGEAKAEAKGGKPERPKSRPGMAANIAAG